MHRSRSILILLALMISASWVAIASGDRATLSATPSVTPTAALADDPAVMGVWEGVMDWPDKAVHLMLLHTGKVLWYRGEGANGSLSYTWDPVTNTLNSQVIGYGVFCSGHSLMPDGRVIGTGGRIGLTGSLGPRYTVIFDPVAEQWSRGPDMRSGRYYPTNLELGDGRTLVFSGYDSTHTFNQMVESFIPGTGPGGTDQWELLPANHYLAYYPRMHLLPSGKVFHTGKDPVSETLDPATGAWQTVATSNYGQRREGTSVMVPPGYDKFMIMGGGSSTNTTEMIDLSAPIPTWTYAAPMNYGRDFLNNVILPDGTILVSGGSTAGVPVLPSELFDPATGTWRVMASMHRDRLYHSTAVLLPDGRAIWAGADSNHTAEIYSPPYLFKGTRPVIDYAPASAQYGQTIRVQSASAANIGSVVLMRPGSTTHSANMDQRYVPVPFTVPVAGALDIQVPSNPNIAPPGYYLLFILDRNKIPSVAKFVHIGDTPAPIANRPPTVFAGADQFVTPPAVAVLNGTVTDDGLPTPPGVCSRIWNKASGPGIVTFADSLSAQTTASFSLVGTYKLCLTGFDGALTARDTISILVGSAGGCASALDRQVATGADDAEESAVGAMFLSRRDLSLVYDHSLQTVGLRFTGLDIPQGATITSAYIQFTAGERRTDATSLVIRGEAADGALPFTATVRNLMLRARTAAAVTWSPAAWTTVGEAGPDQRTPDLSPVIQQIINRPGWSGGSLALLISGTGNRTSMSYEGSANAAPRLHIELSCAGINHAPTADAGPDQTITFPAAANLADVVSDDGLPSPPGEVTETWSKLSGPGNVTFQALPGLFRATNPLHDIAQQATFSLPGTYVLRLTAFDGALTASDDITIVVLPPGSTPLALDRQVASGADDAEETGVTLGNTVDLASGDIDLGQLTVGMRFTGIDIPRGATITRAYLQFTADEAQPDLSPMTMFGQAADSAETFTTAIRNISGRPRTGASIAWTPPAWTVVGAAGPDQRSPDLSPLVQEIVNRPGWLQRSLAVIVTGKGHRTAESFEGAPAGAARLHIEYTAPTPVATALASQPDGAGAEPAIVLTRMGVIYPNPGSGPATVRFELAQPGQVQLDLYDLRGALVRRIADGMRSSGSYSESWDGLDRHGNSVPSGVYLLRFAAGPFRETRRLVVLSDGRTPSPGR